MDYAGSQLAVVRMPNYLALYKSHISAIRAFRRKTPMAVLDTTRTASHAGLFGGLFKLFGTVAAWNDARMTRKALSQLSDRELDDIGLIRGDIDRITF